MLISSLQERYYTAPFKSLKVVSSENKKKNKIKRCAFPYPLIPS